MGHEICRDESRRIFFGDISNHISDYFSPYLKEMKALKNIPNSCTAHH